MAEDPKVFLWFDWNGTGKVLRRATVLKHPLPVGSKYLDSDSMEFVVMEVEFWERSGVHPPSDQYDEPCYVMVVKPTEFDPDDREDESYDLSDWTLSGWVVTN